MTDLPDDEVVTAVLDGEATAEEVARVHADAGLTARLDELRAARNAIAAPVALPSAVDRDAAIAAAMAESVPATVRSAVDLQDRRRRRALRIAQVAAALLIVVGIASAIAALASRSNDKAKTATGTETSAASEDTVPQPAAGGPAASSPASDLGSFSTREDLVDAVRSEKATAASPAAPPLSTRANAATTEAADAASACSTRPDATLVGHAQLSGQPVVVIVFGSPGQQTVEVLDNTCAVLFTTPL